jgi:hypothetical protein
MKPGLIKQIGHRQRWHGLSLARGARNPGFAAFSCTAQDKDIFNV